MTREWLSRGDVLLLVVVLAAFGIADSVYLTYQWYEHATASWCDLDPFWSCTAVRNSPFAAVGGIPTANVGTVGFAAILVLGVLGLRGVDRLGPWSVDRWLLLFAVAGALVGFGLTFIEIFVIQAVCLLCVIGFAIDLGILAPVVLWLR